MPAVELLHVSKSFGSLQAVRDVSLCIEPGEVVAFLGPNGAGKTTTINMMLGLRSPTSGTARLFGRDPRDRKARSRCGVMLQESGVPQTLRVAELITLFRSYYPAPLATEQALKMAGLQEKRDAGFGTLSGGQHQRLFFALAVCGNPDLLFLDEPTVGLDVEGRHDFWTQVRGFAGAGKTVVLTTHYLEEADQIADRIVVIAGGRLIADGAPAAIKARVAGKRLSFDLPSGSPAPAFAGHSMQALQQAGSHFSLLSSAPEALLRSLFAQGLELTNLQVTGAGLEEAFLSLTEESVADG